MGLSLLEYAEQVNNTATGESKQENPMGMNPLVREQEAERAAAERSAQICKTYQENSKKSALLESEILKGLKEGRPLAELFLLAMLALSAVTNTRTAYDQAAEDVAAIYGYGFSEPSAVQMEIRAVEDRLAHMEAALKNPGTPTDAKPNISAAITAHKRSLAKLREQEGAQHE